MAVDVKARRRSRRKSHRSPREPVGTPKPKPVEHWVRIKRAVYRIWRDENGELHHERHG